MANVSVKVLKPFTVKGETFVEDEEIDLPVHLVEHYEKLNYIKVTRAEAAKVEAYQEKQEKELTKEKNASAGPKGKK